MSVVAVARLIIHDNIGAPTGDGGASLTGVLKKPISMATFGKNTHFLGAKEVFLGQKRFSSQVKIPVSLVPDTQNKPGVCRLKLLLTVSQSGFSNRPSP